MYKLVLYTLLLSVVSCSTASPFCLTALCKYGCPQDIQNAVVHASGQAFWIGLPGPAAYCPQPPVTCALYPGNETLLVMGVPGQLSMWLVLVPDINILY